MGFVNELKAIVSRQEIEESRQQREYRRYDRFDSRMEKVDGINATIWGGMGTAGAVLGRDLVAEGRDGAVFVDEADLTEITDDWDALLASKPGSVIRRGVRRRPGAAAVTDG